MTPCILVEVQQMFLRRLLPPPSDTHLWNVGLLVLYYTAPYSRTLSSLYSPPWETEISLEWLNINDPDSFYSLYQYCVKHISLSEEYFTLYNLNAIFLKLTFLSSSGCSLLFYRQIFIYFYYNINDDVWNDPRTIRLLGQRSRVWSKPLLLFRNVVCIKYSSDTGWIPVSYWYNCTIPVSCLVPLFSVRYKHQLRPGGVHEWRGQCHESKPSAAFRQTCCDLRWRSRTLNLCQASFKL
jgi:hypothetical protein